ncbi:MAG TPA: hypothetical protein VG899_14920 [Mycobacteriales bacterium]|nr:hypothetical protein [Mycobacteriales bacterium]
MQPSSVDPATSWIDWRAEAVLALVLMVCIALLGSVVGLIWHAVAPHLDVHAAINNPEEKTKALMGDDLWLALLGIIAGIVCVVAVFLALPAAAADGPGALVGLVAGGLLAMFVADRVGYLVGVGPLRSTLDSAFPTASRQGIDGVVRLLDFKVRATAMLLSWPMASLLLSSMITWLRAVNRPTVKAPAAYPGSP